MRMIHIKAPNGSSRSTGFSCQKLAILLAHYSTGIDDEQEFTTVGFRFEPDACATRSSRKYWFGPCKCRVATIEQGQSAVELRAEVATTGRSNWLNDNGYACGSKFDATGDEAMLAEEIARVVVHEKRRFVVADDMVAVDPNFDVISAFGIAGVLAVFPGGSDEFQDVLCILIELEDEIAGNPVGDTDDTDRVGIFQARL